MLGKIKDAIQGRLYKKCIEEYERALRCQTDPYLLWINENEQAGRAGSKEEQRLKFDIVYMEECGRDFSLVGFDKEYILFVSEEGRIAADVYHEIPQYFEMHRDVNIVYADEDTWMLETQKEVDRDLVNDESAHRIFPWTKPMWSPDTLMSFLYFGNIFAVRREVYLHLEWIDRKSVV